MSQLHGRDGQEFQRDNRLEQRARLDPCLGRQTALGEQLDGSMKPNDFREHASCDRQLIDAGELRQRGYRDCTRLRTQREHRTRYSPNFRGNVGFIGQHAGTLSIAARFRDRVATASRTVNVATMTALEELVTIASMESRTCYAAELGDCAGPLTREHAVSQAILERLNTNGKLVVARSGEVPKSLPPKALAARVLCERHNNALSAVDDEAKRFFDAVDAAADLGARRGRGDDVLVDGVLIERWMLKSLAGAIAAGDVATPEGVEVPRIVPTHWLPFLFGRQRQTATCGLHLFDDGGAPWHGYRHVSRTPLFAPGDIVVGVTMDIGPLHLHYIAEPPPGPRHPRLHRRPRRFKFRHQRSNARWDLRLSWIPPSDGGTFDVSISDE